MPLLRPSYQGRALALCPMVPLASPGTNIVKGLPVRAYTIGEIVRSRSRRDLSPPPAWTGTV